MWHTRCVFCVKCKRHCVTNYIEIGQIIYCPKCVPATYTVQVPEPQVVNLGNKQICGGCHLPIDKFDYSTIFAMGSDWHENCFVCSVCKQPFASDTFYFEGTRLLCATHAGIKK